MDVGEPHQPTVAVYRSARTMVVAVLLLWSLVFVSSGVPRLHERGPWSDDPEHAVLLLAVLAATLVALPTALRAVVHGGPMPAPPPAVRSILAGCAGALVALGVGVAAGVAAVVRHAADLSWDGGLFVVLGLLAGTAALVALAARSTMAGRAEWRQAIKAGDAPAVRGRPDLLDDAATLVARLWPGSAAARVAAGLDRGLDVWRWSPRRHPGVFVVLAAALAGVAQTSWQVVADGSERSLSAEVGLAALVAVAVAGGLAAAITWLGLLRPAPRGS